MGFVGSTAAAETDVLEPAQVADGDDSSLADAIVAGLLVSEWFGDVGSGLDAGVRRLASA